MASTPLQQLPPTKPQDGTLMRPAAVPDGNKGTVSSHEKRPRNKRGCALEEPKSMKQSELDDYQYSGEYPWRDEGLMRKLYLQERRSSRDIADCLGCSKPTVLDWLREHGIPVRGTSESTRIAMRNVPVNYALRRVEGYEAWTHQCGDNRHTVLVHRLLAVAEHGFDAVKDKEVHHINGCKIDNRPENIDLLSSSEHKSLHASKLSWEERVEIEATYSNTDVTLESLAPKYDVSYRTIQWSVKKVREEREEDG